MAGMEERKASAEARREVASRPDRATRREDTLLRYLGAAYYEARHGRAGHDEVERAVTAIDEHVRHHGPVSGTRE